MDRRYLDRRTYSWSEQPRSYICDFCERGFSNAQALGGHMNIHRKDRAKLRQAVLDIDPSSRSSKNADTTMNDILVSDESSITLSQHDREDSTLCTDSRNRRDGSELVELPFFVDMKNVTMDLAKGLGSERNIYVDDDVENKVRIVHEGSSESAEVLDLELRLGLDPCKRPTRGYVER